MQIDTPMLLKTAEPARVPRVQIPLLPPLIYWKERVLGTKKSGTNRFSLTAYSEQNAPKNVCTVPKSVLSDSVGVLPLFMGGAA